MNFSRRDFIKVLSAIAVFLAKPVALISSNRIDSEAVKRKHINIKENSGAKLENLGVESDGYSYIYKANGDTPEKNIYNVIRLMGGIGEFVGKNDIVILKPNAQWWNQGMTNTDAMKGFIDLIFSIPDFAGEIIIAENHQYHPDDSRGWTTKERNGRFNLNELVQHYQVNGYKNIIKYHWRSAGSIAVPLEGDAVGDSRVSGPGTGDGYVWMDDCYYISPSGKECLMTYPVFTSSYSGITIDLKNGAWKDGTYLKDKKVRFINFSALNHHGRYSGVTASVKNLMGVVDMTCGFPGEKPKGTFNTHFIGVSRSIQLAGIRGVWRLGKCVEKFVHHCYRNFHHAGGALGYFMKHVRMPDLNIITAERVGWGSRIDLKRSVQTKTILAGRDPVALDYIAARDVLLPVTPPHELSSPTGPSYHELNNPDIINGPFRLFLQEAHNQGIGNLSREKIRTIT